MGGVARVGLIEAEFLLQAIDGDTKASQLALDLTLLLHILDTNKKMGNASVSLFGLGKNPLRGSTVAHLHFCSDNIGKGLTNPQIRLQEINEVLLGCFMPL